MSLIVLVLVIFMIVVMLLYLCTPNKESVGGLMCEHDLRGSLEGKQLSTRQYDCWYQSLMAVITGNPILYDLFHDKVKDANWFSYDYGLDGDTRENVEPVKVLVKKSMILKKGEKEIDSDLGMTEIVDQLYKYIERMKQIKPSLQLIDVQYFKKLMESGQWKNITSVLDRPPSLNKPGSIISGIVGLSRELEINFTYIYENRQRNLVYSTYNNSKAGRLIIPDQTIDPQYARGDMIIYNIDEQIQDIAKYSNQIEQRVGKLPENGWHLQAITANFFISVKGARHQTAMIKCNDGWFIYDSWSVPPVAVKLPDGSISNLLSTYLQSHQNLGIKKSIDRPLKDGKYKPVTVVMIFTTNNLPISSNINKISYMDNLTLLTYNGESINAILLKNVEYDINQINSQLNLFSLITMTDKMKIVYVVKFDCYVDEYERTIKSSESTPITIISMIVTIYHNHIDDVIRYNLENDTRLTFVNPRRIITLDLIDYVACLVIIHNMEMYKLGYLTGNAEPSRSMYDILMSHEIFRSAIRSESDVSILHRRRGLLNNLKDIFLGEVLKELKSSRFNTEDGAIPVEIRLSSFVTNYSNEDEDE